MSEREPQLLFFSTPVYRWRFTGIEFVPIILDANGNEMEVVWAPQAGSQAAFLHATEVEVLFTGTRGGCGKSDALLFSYLQFVDIWKKAWKGIILRQSHPALREMIDRSRRWIPRIWPDAEYNEIKFRWTFPSGATLSFDHLAERGDFDKYQGAEFAFIGFEELVTWDDLRLYKLMFSCLRSPIPGVPLMVRSTTNPYGPAHNAIKDRFNLPIPNAKSMVNLHGACLGPLIVGKVDATGIQEPDRRAIHGHLLENKLFLRVNPGYIQKTKASCNGDENLERAWLDGDWDITSGGLIDGVWNKAKEFCVWEGLTPKTIPEDWVIFRVYDYGWSAPFAVCWFAASNGGDIELENGKVRSTRRGDLFLVREWYGWTGVERNKGLELLTPQITKGIIEREVEWGWRGQGFPGDNYGPRGRVKDGPADSMIFDDVNNICIATEFEKPVEVKGVRYRGLRWEKADKGPNSRPQGWDQLRQRLNATIPNPGGGRERPGLFISSDCHQWKYTVPQLTRDEKNPEDCPKNSEDHLGDCTRYALRFEYQPIINRRI